MCFIKKELGGHQGRFIKLGLNLRDEVFAMTLELVSKELNHFGAIPLFF